jgi:hypothetical protein
LCWTQSRDQAVVNFTRGSCQLTSLSPIQRERELARDRFEIPAALLALADDVIE